MNGYQPSNNYNYGQMPIQNQSQSNIAGRYVNDFNEISANDVSMNTPSVFIKNDKSEIQVREWSPNGQIVLTSYLPHIDKNTQEVDKLSNDTQKSKFDPKTEVLEPLFERLEELESKIDKLSRPARVKKEGE